MFQGLTFSQIFNDILLLLAHACILTIHIFIPEGNYGKFVRVYHPSKLSTVFSLKEYSSQENQGQYHQRRARNPLMGHGRSTFKNRFTSPKKNQNENDSTLSYRPTGGRWSIDDWDEPVSFGSFSDVGGSIPSTSSRTKYLERERGILCFEIPNSVKRTLHWLSILVMKAFYVLGALFCLPLIAVSLYFMTRNIYDHEWRKNTIMLIPGFNISLGVEAVLLFISVLSVSIIHEWGHIFCATLFDYNVKQFGGMAFGPVWMGVSEIEWTSREEGSTKKFQRDDWKTKIVILLAGIWQNFCLCAIVYLLATVFWKDHDGIRVLGGDQTDTFPESNMRLYRINDGEFLRNHTQFLSQVKEVSELTQPLFYCIPKNQIIEIGGACCDTKTIIGNQFCFQEVFNPNNSVCTSIKQFTVRNVPNEGEKCFHLNHLRENWQVISMEVGQHRDMSDLQKILFYGDVEEFLLSLEVTDRHLKWGLDDTVLPVISDTLYRFIQIIFTLSFGLGMLNLLPIPMFDGSNVVSTILFEIAKWGASSRFTKWMVKIHFAFVAVCCVLFGLNVLLSLWNAYTLLIH